MFTDKGIQNANLDGASARYDYPRDRIFLALIAGRFHYKDGRGETAIRDHFAATNVGGGPLRLHNIDEVADSLIQAVTVRDTYVDDPVVMTIRALREADRISPGRRAAAG